MSGSKLDARQRARDFRHDPDQSKHRRHEGGRKKLHHVYRDLTTVTYLQNRPDEDTRFITLDALPDMTEDWIDKMVYVRSPVGGVPDRMYLGIQSPDDTLAWIEISIMSPAPPTIGGVPGAPTYTWVGSIGSGIAFSPSGYPDGISCDGSGDIWITNRGSGRLHKYSPAGSLLLNILLPGTTPAPASAAVALGSGDVFSSTPSQQRVHHYNSAGVAQPIWTPQAGSQAINALAFNNAESLIFYVDSQSTQHWARAYNYPALTLNTTFCTVDLTEPYGIDVDASGIIYVSDHTQHVVRVYSAAYALIDTWGTLGASGTGNGEFNKPGGVHVDKANGHVYVVDQYNHRIQVFETDGDFLTSFGTPGTGNGQFQYPIDVTTSGTNLYVADSQNNRISVWAIS